MGLSMLKLVFLVSNLRVRCYTINQEPTRPSKQPIRTCYVGHVTGNQPISDHYFLIRSVHAINGRALIYIYPSASLFRSSCLFLPSVVLSQNAQKTHWGSYHDYQYQPHTLARSRTLSLNFNIPFFFSSDKHSSIISTSSPNIRCVSPFSAVDLQQHICSHRFMLST